MVRRVFQLFAGLVAFGVGIGLMVRAGIGIAPWDVLAQGLSNQTGVSFGMMTLLLGFVILLLWIPIKQKPGIGTVLNVLVLGPVAQVVLDLTPEDNPLWLRIVMFAVGIVVVGLGTGLYIGASFGPGPRDGLMTGLHALTGWPIWAVRSGIELSVLLIGWVLGGNVGLGTVAFALLIGPIAEGPMRWFDLSQNLHQKKFNI